MNDFSEPFAVHVESPRRITTKATHSIKSFIKGRKKLSLVLFVVFVFTLYLAIVFFMLTIQSLGFYRASKSLALKLTSQDLDVKNDIALVKKEQRELVQAYKIAAPLKYIPLAGVYVEDLGRLVTASTYATEAVEILVNALIPYEDIFAAKGTDESSDTTAQRIDFMVSSIPVLVPEIDKVSQKLGLINNEIKNISPNRYPNSLFGLHIRKPIKGMVDATVALEDIVRRGKELISVSPYLLGVENARNYLILFQNDKELRPTGGFITAYTQASVTKGVFQPVSSSDIYTLDSAYTPKIPASEPMVRYIQGPYVLDKNYRLRDINWSPDFAESMELFLKEGASAGLPEFDGVIAVDTELVVNILGAVGAVNVPGYGEFSTNHDERCSCPQVIYELESFSDVEGPIVWDPLDPTKIIYAPENFDNRKEIIGPLMNTIVTAALTTPKENLPSLFSAIYKAVNEKHVLLYMHDERVQKAIESYGVGGRIIEYDGDYLHINNANLGGRKSNLYVTEEVKQEIVVSEDGSVEKELEIRYKNPQVYDGWLNSVLPNWTRVYLPKGSEIIQTTGFEDPGEVYEELGKTVVAGGFRLRPQGVSIVRIKYKLPFKISGDYKIFIQKQPGTFGPLHSIEVNGTKEEFALLSDIEKVLELN